MVRTMSEVSSEVIQSAIAVHRVLGPGLLESAYQRCLEVEFSHRGLQFEKEKSIGLSYRGIILPGVSRLDFVVEGSLVVEAKSVARWESIFDAQLLTYFRLTGLTVGLLLNFNVPLMRDGIKRLVNRYQFDPVPPAPLR